MPANVAGSPENAGIAGGSIYLSPPSRPRTHREGVFRVGDGR